MQKIIQEEEITAKVLSTVAPEDQVYEKDILENITSDSNSILTSKSIKEERTFTADNGTKYMFDNEIGDWVEDDTVDDQHENENEMDGADHDENEEEEEEDKSRHLSMNNNIYIYIEKKSEYDFILIMII